MLLRPSKIIIHHSATADGVTFSWPAIERYHTTEQGWKDIGYHAGIEEIGADFVCVFGRPDVVPGAHTKGWNNRSLGFCFVGNYDRVGPTEARLRVACRRVLAPWILRHGLRVEDLVPHSDFANKTCPGTLFDMGLLRTICAQELEQYGSRMG